MAIFKKKKGEKREWRGKRRGSNPAEPKGVGPLSGGASGSPLLPGGSGKGQFISNIVSVVLVFLIISTLYSTISSTDKVKTSEVPVSQIAQDISAGTVKSVSVSGDMVNVEYVDGTKKISKKEIEASFSETLVNYGVSAEKLAKVEISVKNESGFGYWALNLLPFIVPLLLV
ncbi:MAG: hypothetical protein UY07_C0019G0001, partial [Parcubacteria group bacterium GW2011_GWA1_47_8]